jgi:hypothetical protein
MTTIFARLIAVAVKNPAAVRTSQVINRLSIQPVTVGAPPRMAALIAPGAYRIVYNVLCQLCSPYHWKRCALTGYYVGRRI